MKHQLILATVVVAAMTGCTNEEFVGQWAQQTETAISFGKFYSAVTRGASSGDAAKLGNSYVVYGWKNSDDVVFDHYNVEYADGTDNSTESNLVGWEYAGISPVNADGKTKVNGFDAVTKQSIKYWDKNADKYQFVAFSRGKGVTVSGDATYAEFSKVVKANIGNTAASGDPVYSATGTVEQLAQVYVADLFVASGSAYYRETPVKPVFRSTSAKIRVAFYETVPGYSIKSLTFYNASNVSGDAVVLTTSGNDLPSGSGTMKVYIDNAGKASVTYDKDPAGGTNQMSFGQLVLSAAKEVAEASGDYLGRTSSAASYTNANKDLAYVNVLPTGTGVELKVKVGYTLVSVDGKGEEIVIDPVEAVIPAVYTAWQLNYAYTYIFKISDATGGLEPITLDACITEVQNGEQETVTHMLTKSITSYAKGVNPTANSEYKKNSNIYLSVNGGTLTSTNAKLYTVTVEDGACQTITENSVANCLANGTQNPTGIWTVTDLNGKKLTVTSATAPSIETEIAATDAPDGIAISGNFAMFKPTAAGTYAFEYTDGAKKYYKVIIVVD